MNEVWVIGMGSAHGADRLGWAVVEALKARALPSSVRLENCAIPAQLPALLLQSQETIVVDAMLGEGPSGTLHQFGVADLPQQSWRAGSHGLGVVEAIRLAIALGLEASAVRVIALDVGDQEAALSAAWVSQLADAVYLQLAAEIRQ